MFKLYETLLLIFLFDALLLSQASAPNYNSTACTQCASDVASCALVPNATQPQICYDGASNVTNLAYEYDPSIPYPLNDYCSTCNAYGYDFFVNYDLLYGEVMLWSSSNPLCALAAATNIPSLVSGGSMSGWTCEGPGLYTESDYCNGWTGVSCTAAPSYPMNMTISSISLPSKGIVGTLPPQLSLLFYTTSLDFSGNSLVGTVPSAISGMYNLENLDLSNNGFTNTIPTAIGVLSALNNLWLQSNEFRGTIPTQLGYLADASAMNMSSNRLTGSVPSQLCSDQQLTYLNVEGNNLTCYEKCIADVDEFYPGTTTDSCYAEFMEAQGPALCALYAATNIPQLVDEGIMGGWNCSEGQPVGEFCDWFGVYCGLSISDDPAAGFADDIIIVNTTVYELNLPALGISGTLPSELSALSYLLVINVEQNSLSGSIPNEYGSLRRMATFLLGDNSLLGTIPSSLESWNNIQTMELQRNNFTGSIPSSFGDHYSLGFLLVNENNFEGAIPQEICNDTGLNLFDFSDNPRLTCYPNCLSSVPNLINGDNITTCNHTELPPLSEEHKIYIIVGTIVGVCCLVFVFLYVFARRHIMWLVGEVQDFAERMTEEASSLLADLDFSDIRASSIGRPSFMRDYPPEIPQDEEDAHGAVSMKTFGNPIFQGRRLSKLEEEPDA